MESNFGTLGKCLKTLKHLERNSQVDSPELPETTKKFINVTKHLTKLKKHHQIVFGRFQVFEYALQ